MRLNFDLLGAVDIPVSQYDKYSKEQKQQIREIQKELTQKKRRINALKHIPDANRNIKTAINAEYGSKWEKKYALAKLGLIADGQKMLPLPVDKAPRLTKEEANQKRSQFEKTRWAFAKAIKANYFADDKKVTLNAIRKDIRRFYSGLQGRYVNDVQFQNPSPQRWS